ncbi:MAG: hypothetical protein JWM26_4422 [Betaproteobacteria bacterium]|nr:hypothetical protein [Betaproteobacteria bacterium]
MLLRLVSGLFRRHPPRRAASDDLAAALNRGAALTQDGQLAAALQVYLGAAKKYPREAAPHIRAGNLLRKLWRIEEAVHAHTRALELSPDSHALILSAVLFQSHYLAGVSAEALFQMHCR